MNTDAKRGVPFSCAADAIFFRERNCDHLTGCARRDDCRLLAIAGANKRIPDAWVKEPVSYRCTELLTPERHRKALKDADAVHVAEMQGGLF